MNRLVTTRIYAYDLKHSFLRWPILGFNPSATETILAISLFALTAALSGQSGPDAFVAAGITAGKGPAIAAPKEATGTEARPSRRADRTAGLVPASKGPAASPAVNRGSKTDRAAQPSPAPAAPGGGRVLAVAPTAHALVLAPHPLAQPPSGAPPAAVIPPAATQPLPHSPSASAPTLGKAAFLDGSIPAYAAPEAQPWPDPFDLLFAAPAEKRREARWRLHDWAYEALPMNVTVPSEQHCLAEAIYFEARGEPETGQAAVAQVVLNRVRSPAFPKSICGVVYQNAEMTNRCQFSFACGREPPRVTDEAAWRRAEDIARKAVAGEVWLPEVGDSTHYHAAYVSPAWRGGMRRLARIGVHIFYRTHRGGWS